jgi:hypothetical protein
MGMTRVSPPVRAKTSYSVRGHTARKLIIGVFIVAYVAVAHMGGRMSPRLEFFPVFNWSLFTHVHPVRGLLELYVSRIGDKTFDEPVNYFELDDYFETARNRSTDVKKTLERYVMAKQAGDTATMEKLRGVIEARHLGGHGTVQYEIRYVVFKPVDRWLDGSILRQQVVAQFDTGAAP